MLGFRREPAFGQCSENPLHPGLCSEPAYEIIPVHHDSDIKKPFIHADRLVNIPQILSFLLLRKAMWEVSLSIPPARVRAGKQVHKHRKPRSLSNFPPGKAPRINWVPRAARFIRLSHPNLQTFQCPWLGEVQHPRCAGSLCQVLSVGHKVLSRQVLDKKQQGSA